MRVGILGGGISGVGAALLSKSKGHDVWMSDGGTIADNFKKQLENNHIPFEEKGHTIEKLENCDIVIKSPGIPRSSELITNLINKGVEVIGEIEWAYRHCEGQIIAITGSNGKTTTTNLCHHLLQYAGFNTKKVGNVGTAFCAALLEEPAEWYVCEISSFQLEDNMLFAPDVGVLLNITADHLDRYQYSLDLYADAKMLIAKNMIAEDAFIYNALDPVTKMKVGQAKLQTKLSPIIEEDFISRNEVRIVNDVILDLSTSVLQGKHNQLNVIAAARAAYLAGCPEDELQDGLNTFVNDPHRMEKVGERDNVVFINDSKATNVDAVYYALDAMENQVVWIVGGQDKGNDYEPLFGLVKDKVKAIVCLGIDNKKLFETFSTRVNYITETTQMGEAVTKAASLASPGDTVLLSPACASFDLFKDYRDRGDQFREAVARL